MSDPLCSELSLQNDEPLAGTASVVARWVLIEDPGPWGYDALSENSLPNEPFNEVRKWARSVSARVVLIRKGPKPVVHPRSVFVVSSEPGNEWIAAFTGERIDDVLATDRKAFEDAEGFRGQRRESMYLVCTHGRHDLCCSVNGIPVARTLNSNYYDQAWECSHIGGDRFAANLVCLPHGMYFGRLTNRTVLEVVDKYEHGMVDLETYRGRSAWPFHVQAAETFVREKLGLLGVQDAMPQSWRETGESTWAVRLVTSSHDSVDVSVRSRRSSRAYRLTCRSDRLGRPPLYETVIERVS